MYKLFLKRIIDFCVAFVALSVLAVPLLVVYVWLAVANKGAGALFFQERPGYKGKVFRIVKFKTMTDECDANGVLLPDNQRLTKVGTFVRSLSIDELPQFWNVLKGDMSLIGPRPLLVEYLPLYNAHQARRHDVRPGITGWAQCHGRNALSWTEKFDYDVYYVDNCSLWLDIKVVLCTVRCVLRKEGINNDLATTMFKFDGTN
ncbi:MAG: sugar transferase [Bacteroidales bacterium]|nr:sugar transferase [Bacteroidales bacterium]